MAWVVLESMLKSRPTKAMRPEFREITQCWIFTFVEFN